MRVRSCNRFSRLGNASSAIVAGQRWVRVDPVLYRALTDSYLTRDEKNQVLFMVSKTAGAKQPVPAMALRTAIFGMFVPLYRDNVFTMDAEQRVTLSVPALIAWLQDRPAGDAA